MPPRHPSPGRGTKNIMRDPVTGINFIMPGQWRLGFAALKDRCHRSIASRFKTSIPRRRVSFGAAKLIRKWVFRSLKTLPGLKTMHPERQSCLQCHAPSAALDQAPAGRLP